MPRLLIPDATTPDYAAAMLDLLERGKLKMGYPSALDKYIALRESDRSRLANYANWDSTNLGPYRVDPLPEKISITFADFMWGADPTIDAAVEEDDELLEEIVVNNDLSDELHRAEEIKSSEGQVWWRIYRDDQQFPYPIIEWHSRTEVIPWYRGKRLLAVAIVDIVEDTSESTDNTDIAQGTRSVWRRLEVYGPNVTYNALFKGEAGTLGNRVAIDSHADTLHFAEEWRHGLPMLAGVIYNRRGKKHEGRSDYHGVEDLIFDLNEAHSIDRSNFRLAGRKRAVMPEKYRRADGSAEDADVYFAESEDEMEADTTLKILEYTYDGSSSIQRKQDLTATILTRVGLARQLVDPNSGDGGSAASGVALRTRLIPMTLTARGKERPWDEELPSILMRAQQVDALDENRLGFGRPWTAPAELPSVERGSILPEDPQEELQYHVDAVNADLESQWTAISALHPDWTEEQVQEELDRIMRENAQLAGFPIPGEEDSGEELPPEEEILEEEPPIEDIVPEEELV